MPLLLGQFKRTLQPKYKIGLVNFLIKKNRINNLNFFIILFFSGTITSIVVHVLTELPKPRTFFGKQKKTSNSYTYVYEFHELIDTRLIEQKFNIFIDEIEQYPFVKGKI